MHLSPISVALELCLSRDLTLTYTVNQTRGGVKGLEGQALRS